MNAGPQRLVLVFDTATAIAVVGLGTTDGRLLSETAWLAGYRRVANLPAQDEAEIWTFILFRRLLLVAWIGSHRAVDIAQELGAGYTRGSCDLAEKYLSRAGPI